MSSKALLRFHRNLKSALVGVLTTRAGLMLFALMPIIYALMCFSTLQKSINQLSTFSHPLPLDIAMVRSDSISSGDGISQLFFAAFGALVFLQQSTTAVSRAELLAIPKRSVYWVSRTVAVVLLAGLAALVSVVGACVITFIGFNSAGLPVSVFSGSALWHIVIASIALPSAALIGFAMAAISRGWVSASLSIFGVFIFAKAVLGSALVIGSSGLALMVYNMNWFFPSVGLADRWPAPGILEVQWVNDGQLQLLQGQAMAILIVWAIGLSTVSFWVNERRAA